MHAAPPLGRLLVSSGLVTQEALDEVVAFQKSDGRRLGELLVEKGVVHPHQLAQFLSHHLACPWVSLERIEVTREAAKVLPREIALKHRMVPVHLRTAKGQTALYVAMDDPTDDVALAAASSAATMPVKAMIALAADIKSLLDRLYGDGQAGEVTEAMTPTLPPISFTPPSNRPLPPAGAPPAVIPPPNSNPLPHIVIPIATKDGAPGVSGRMTKPPPPKLSQQPPPSPEAILDEEDMIEVGPTSRPPAANKGPAILDGSYAKGSTIDTRYELIRDLGGRVPGSHWEVRHLKTQRRAILKIGIRRAADETEAEAVAREQLVLSRFQHPGAVDLRDAGKTDIGDPYLVLEMLEGRTLEGLVAARGALPSREACALMRQLADVLASAHDAGVLHHAVRPENVVVVRDPWGIEHLKLTNWSSATIGDGPLEPAVDLAGLGACAFLALAGRSRADGEDVTQTDLDGEVTGVIARAIGGANARRFASAKAFVDALEAAAPRRRDSILLLHATPEQRIAIPKAEHAEPAGRASAAPPAGELRRHPRAAYRTPVRVQVPSVGAIDGRIEEISAHGVFVVTRRALTSPLADGTKVTVRFALPLDGQVVLENGIVRWTRCPKSDDGAAPHAIGIELTMPSAEAARQIDSYVAAAPTTSTAPTNP
jgi:serine/threonine protein kinase